MHSKWWYTAVCFNISAKCFNISAITLFSREKKKETELTTDVPKKEKKKKEREREREIKNTQKSKRTLFDQTKQDIMQIFELILFQRHEQNKNKQISAASWVLPEGSVFLIFRCDF